MKIHHIGIACENIDSAIEDYSRLFYVQRRSGQMFDPKQDATVELVETNTGLDVEFISSPKVTALVKKGITYYHLCYETDNLDEQIEKMVARGAMLVCAPQSAILFDGRRVAFLYTTGGLVELLET